MQKGFKVYLTILLVGLLSFISTPAFARSVSMKDAGVALWIFLIIGAIIVLLQLVPAAILFFAFIGTTTGFIAKKKAPEKITAEEKVSLSGYEPAPAKR
jgi:predicted membrane protein